jgi:hypothetical protein
MPQVRDAAWDRIHRLQQESTHPVQVPGILSSSEHWILLKLLLVGSSTARPSPTPSSYFSLNSPVQANDFSSLIIFFTLIFSLGALVVVPLFLNDADDEATGVVEFFAADGTYLLGTPPIDTTFAGAGAPSFRFPCTTFTDESPIDGAKRRPRIAHDILGAVSVYE